jgi:sporulation protein YlmC with PRC-barrel domain
MFVGAVPAMAADPIDKSAIEKPEAGKLIGHRVENAEGQKIGEIEAIHINKSGKVEDVIVGVGGFLGIGERDVSISWKTLKISADGNKVTTDLTKEKLKEMPAYTYPQPNYRGTVFATPPL